MNYESFKKIPKGVVFASGLIPNEPGGLYMTDVRQGDLLMWVAKKGAIDDWAIYAHWKEKGISFVTTNGHKVSKRDIRDLVPCDEEMFNAYRL